MARYNKIFAGPVSENVPQAREATSAAALTPGQLVVESSGAFVVAPASTAGHIFVVEENYVALKGVSTAYGIGETVIALRMLDEQFFNVLIPTGVNVAKHAPLSPGASGKAKIAATTNYVFAFAEEAYNNTSGSDQLIRVRAAHGFNAA